MELEQGKNADFWRDMTIITEDEIAKLRKLEASGKGPGNAGRATGDTPGCALGEAPLGLVGAAWAGWLHRRGLGFLSGGLPARACLRATRGQHWAAGAAGPERGALPLACGLIQAAPVASFKQLLSTGLPPGAASAGFLFGFQVFARGFVRLRTGPDCTWREPVQRGVLL